MHTFSDVEEFESSALMACCPWLDTIPYTSVRCVPVRSNGCKEFFELFLVFSTQFFFLLFLAFDEIPERNELHLTLAYKYDKMDSITLNSMLDRFEYIDASSWELRLYSRDIRVGQNQVCT